MRNVRNGLSGKFIRLADAARAVGDRVSVSTQEVDLHLSLNPREADITEAQRIAVGYHLRFAHGAYRLLQLMNQPAQDRPKWYDAAPGHPILDDTLGRRGLNVLSHWSKLVWPSESKSVSGASSAIPPSHEQGPEGVAMDLQFNVDELIQFLNAKKILHSLGKQLNLPATEVLISPAVNRFVAEDSYPQPSPPFRGPLRGVLAIAWHNAGHKCDHVAVFAELCAMAALDKPRTPLLRYAKGSVWYDDASTKSGESFLTVEKLLDRAYFRNKTFPD